MVIIGVILLLLVVAVVAFIVIVGSGPDATVHLQWDALNVQWEPTAALLFGLGAATLALLALSGVLIRSGVKQKVHKGQEMRRLRRLERETGANRTVTSDAPTSRTETSRTADDYPADDYPQDPPRRSAGSDEWDDSTTKTPRVDPER